MNSISSITDSHDINKSSADSSLKMVPTILQIQNKKSNICVLAQHTIYKATIIPINNQVPEANILNKHIDINKSIITDKKIWQTLHIME